MYWIYDENSSEEFEFCACCSTTWIYGKSVSVAVQYGIID